MGLLSWLFGQGAKTAAQSAVPTLLSPLVVQGVRSAVTPTISSGISSALGSAIGNSISSSLGKAISGSPSTAATYTDPYPNATNVSGVDVTAPAAPSAAPSVSPLSSLGGALIPALASAATNVNAPASAPPPLANVGDGGATNLSGVDVVGSANEPQQFDQAVSGILGNVPDLTPTGEDALHTAGPMDPTKDNKGLLAEGAGLLGLLGLSPKDLLGLGILGAGLAGGQGKGTDTSGLQQQVQSGADQNAANANMLTQRALAGMSGDIGGKGMSYIARQVRTAQAAIRQRYAQMGMSGSSAETEDLNNAVEAGIDEQFKIGQSQAAAGLNAAAMMSGQSATAYLALLNAATAKNTALGNSLANFAGAVAGRLFQSS